MGSGAKRSGVAIVSVGERSKAGYYFYYYLYRRYLNI